tara:strand:+ start:203 stop:505 length:303 start_codon:yes stop_codon:yes gene_type:complete
MAYQNNIASRIINSVNITSAGTSAQSSSAPFGATIARIATSANVNIVIGPNPTATAAGTLVQTSDASYFVIKPASTVGGTDGEKVASIGTATVNVTFLEG